MFHLEALGVLIYNAGEHLLMGNDSPIVNAFTCCEVYAVLIISGLKCVDNWY